VKLAVATIHCPVNSQRMDWLYDQEKVLANDPRVTWFVSEDLYRNGVWWNYRQAAERLVTTGATHVLVLQDDLLLCDNFLDGCFRLIELKPDRLVSIFYMRPKVALACEEADTGWFVGIDLVYGGQFLCPIEFLRDFLPWVDRYVRPELKHDDVRWRIWSRYSPASPREVWTPVGSLLQHRGRGRSLMGHNNPGNRAPRFCGDANDVDWAYGIDHPLKASSTTDMIEVRWAYVSDAD
jgi:hypothetical protein